MLVSFETFIERANRARTTEELVTEFLATVRQHGLDRMVFCLQTRHRHLDIEPGFGVLQNYPEDWMKHYFENGYDRIDPVTTYCLNKMDTFTWAEIPERMKMSRRQFQCLNMGIEAGLYNGVCTPHLGTQPVRRHRPREQGEARFFRWPARPHHRLLQSFLHRLSAHQPQEGQPGAQYLPDGARDRSVDMGCGRQDRWRDRHDPQSERGDGRHLFQDGFPEAERQHARDGCQQGAFVRPDQAVGRRHPSRDRVRLPEPRFLQR